MEIRGIYSRKDHGVKLKTLSQQYMEDPEFRHALETTRSEAAALARSELEGLMLKSGDVKELHRRLDHLDSALRALPPQTPPYPFVNQRGSYWP